ncbi:hypothetical protein F5890DRAFT_1472105 [Lentinula detonsa]|uniref:Uncharacterized protein n=1 Tax=Lentinula detonsa TaxID=2804962 RepID=A0AA38Q5I9_9AGAR|nr:hypothetical protein F5890DRAFT_1472105 [Lentinula detonsa]
MKSLLGVFVTLPICFASLTSPSDASPIGGGSLSQLEACSGTSGVAPALASSPLLAGPMMVLPQETVPMGNHGFSVLLKRKWSQWSCYQSHTALPVLTDFGDSVSSTQKKTVFKNQASVFIGCLEHPDPSPWRNWNIQNWPRKNDGELQPLGTGV